MIDEKLKEYIENNIKTQYEKANYGGHGWEHIQEVINRSFELMEKFNLNLDPNMVYVVASYHDLGYQEDPDNHEIVSSRMFLEDNKIKEFFNDEELKIISEAILDHKANCDHEARSDYGKLVSSADRSVDVLGILKRASATQMEKHKDENPTKYDIIEYTYKKLSSKYGKGGYAKMYFVDDVYEEFLDKMDKLCSDKDRFVQLLLEVM